MKVARRFRSRKPIIQSVKNIVDSTLIGVGAGVTSNVSLAFATNVYSGGVTSVPVGATVSSVYLFVQILPSTGTANVDWFIWKNPANNLTRPVPGAVGGDKNRRHVLHEEKGIPGNAADGAYPLTFKGVVKIPKGRQRWGEDDNLEIVLSGADVHNICIKCIYKFYQ